MKREVRSKSVGTKVTEAELAGGPHLSLGAPYLEEMWETKVV